MSDRLTTATIGELTTLVRLVGWTSSRQLALYDLLWDGERLDAVDDDELEVCDWLCMRRVTLVGRAHATLRELEAVDEDDEAVALLAAEVNELLCEAGDVDDAEGWLLPQLL